MNPRAVESRFLRGLVVLLDIAAAVVLGVLPFLLAGCSIPRPPQTGSVGIYLKRGHVEADLGPVGINGDVEDFRYHRDAEGREEAAVGTPAPPAPEAPAAPPAVPAPPPVRDE